MQSGKHISGYLPPPGGYKPTGMIKACAIRENSTVLILNATLNIVFLDKQTKNTLFIYIRRQ